MASGEDALRVLVSIDASLKTILSVLQKTAPKDTAAADDLDSQYGNPEIKAADPRDWSGPSMRGRKFSECPPEYLDLLAERFDYFARKADEEGKVTAAGKPVGPYNRKDAARARGWAARLRQGWQPPAGAWSTAASAPAPVQAGFPSDAAPAISDDDTSF